jgi:uncharacterized protein (TIGR02118 family)
MYQLIACYAHPRDPHGFLKHYRTTHAPLAARMPGLRSYTWSVCETPDGSPPPHFAVAALTWDDRESALAALDSPIGRETIGDLTNFAGAGVTVEYGDVVSAL